MPVLSTTCQWAPSLPDVTGSSGFPKPLASWPHCWPSVLGMASHWMQRLSPATQQTPATSPAENSGGPWHCRAPVPIRPGHASLCVLMSDVSPLPGKLLLTAGPVPQSEPSLAQRRPARLSSPAPRSLDSSFPSTHHLGATGWWGLAPVCPLTTFLCESSGLAKTISSVPQITHVFLIP